MIKENDLRSKLMSYVLLLGLEPSDIAVQKVLRSMDKKIPLTHLMAELLLYSHLISNGFDYVSIEETIGAVRCDVYARMGLEDTCIEIETHIVPVEHILEGVTYIRSRHVKKVIQILKEGIKRPAFAYPVGTVPLVPLELLIEPGKRSKDDVEKLIGMAKNFYGIDTDEAKYIENFVLEVVYVYDIERLRVRQIDKDLLKDLVMLYSRIIE